MNKYPKRKSIRLKQHDYSQPGYYYVTICTYDRKCLFGKIIDHYMDLNNAGKIIDQILRGLPEYYRDICIDYYVVMPNHVHAIIQITNPVGGDLCVVPDKNNTKSKQFNKYRIYTR